MKRNICTILLNGSKTECQTIYWNTEDHKLYTTHTEEPVDDYEYDTLEEAVEAADAMWGRTDTTGAWELEWIESED